MGICVVPPALVTEYCSRGSLYSVLSTARRDPGAAVQLGWRRRLTMALEAGAGLLYLHTRGIVHRDCARGGEGHGGRAAGCTAGWGAG